MSSWARLLSAAGLAIFVWPASGQTPRINQPYGGDYTLTVTPDWPAGTLSASLDVFIACPPSPGTSLLQPGMQHSASGAAPVVLTLAKPLAAGFAVCVVETLSNGAAGMSSAVAEDISVKPPAPPSKPSIDPVGAGSVNISVKGIAPGTGYTAVINLYPTCQPPAGSAALNVPGAMNTFDGSANEITIPLVKTVNAKDTLCAIEVYAPATHNPPTVPSDSITVGDAITPVPPAGSPSSKTAIDNALFATGLDVSAGASTNAGANYTLDIGFDEPVFGPRKKANAAPPAGTLPLDAWMWLSGYVRLASIAQPGAISNTTSITSYISPAINNTPADLVQSGELLLSVDLGTPGHLGDPAQPKKFLLTLSGGAITPLSSAPSTPTVYIVSQALYNYYASTPPLAAAQSAITSACGATFSTTVPCYVAFAPQERTSFFRDWSAGFKFKNYYYNGSGNDSYSFPGITTITFGQNEYVTGGAMRGFVLHAGSVQPLPGTVAGSLAGYLYVFGSMDMIVERNIPNGGAPQFNLATAPSDVSPGASNVAQVSVAQPNRDRYRFGVELDLTKVLALIKAKSSNPAPASPAPASPQ